MKKELSMRHLKDNDPELVRFYDHEFKKWHRALTLIIAVGIPVFMVSFLQLRESFD